jgi:hypothetical protein
MRALRLEAGPQYKSWEARGFRIVKDCVQKLAESLSFDVVTQGTQKVTRIDAERWFQKNPTFIKMLEHVFMHLYHYRTVKSASDERKEKDDQNSGGSGGSGKQKAFINETSLLPVCDNILYIPDYPAFIDISQILFINSNLPTALQSKWRFLFSSQIHGESFSTLLGRIMDQGPTVIIVEDSNGYIFGGFATNSWSLSPNFVGDDHSFLFSLRPKMRAFPTTGYNDHFQYLNLHQQTMPNGLVSSELFSEIPVIFKNSHYFQKFPLFSKIPIIFKNSHYFLKFPVFSVIPIIFKNSHYFQKFPLFSEIPIIFCDSRYFLKFPLFSKIPIIF